MTLLQHFQNHSRALARKSDHEPPLIETVELLDDIKRGIKGPTTIEQKRRLFVASFSLVDTYFILAADAAMIKIGKTVDIKKRLSTLRTMSPVALDLICTILYDDNLEHRIHKHLSAHRAHGEWFHANEDVLDFIRGYRSGGVRWVVEKVGEAGKLWMNSRKGMPKSMRDEYRTDYYDSLAEDPDFTPKN